ncbi:MAG: LexA family protein [Cumulibacter sp.]
MSKSTRPTKKQFELLAYIDEFIKEHSYSPSYREIMRGCNYTSVATVALHVNNLVKRGHLIKRENSARSLEVVKPESVGEKVSVEIDHAKELIKEIESRLKAHEQAAGEELLNEIYVLVGALKVLGHHDHALTYATQLNNIKG